MSNIIIKNQHGQTIRVHVYGDNQLPKHQADLVFFRSFLPDFWRIEERFN
jgi:hypothetical protein